MKTSMTSDLYVPFVLLFLGAIVPSLLAVFAPEYPLFFESLWYWYGALLTLGTSLLAIKLTFQRLIFLAPQFNKAMVFESEVSSSNKHTVLKANACAAELLIMGLCLFSISQGHGPSDFASLLLYTSARLGVILFVLGGIVMMITHNKLRKL